MKIKTSSFAAALAVLLALALVFVAPVSADGEIAKVGDDMYADLQEAIKAAAPSGTVEILADVTVETWKMFAENLGSDNSGEWILLTINGMTIDGNGHNLTINDIVSNGNGGKLFHDVTKLNVNDLTIKCTEGGGISLQSGTINNVTFDGGSGVFPGNGEIKIIGCTFKTNSHAIYYETARDNLVVTDNIFTLPSNANAIILRGNEEFTNNIVNSGRNVNVASGSPLVSGNYFYDVNFKVYNGAAAEITGNTINTLVFNDDTAVKSTFADNTMSETAQATLDDMTVAKIGATTYGSLTDAIAAAESGDTITLMGDVESSETITIEKSITLDLNGHTISGTCDSSQSHLIMVKNTATLNVVDNSEEQDGKITFAQGSSNVGWTIDLEGNLNLFEGTIELTGESWSIGYAVDVRPNSWGTEYTEGTVFHMYGGKLISSDGAVRVASSSADSHEKVSATFIMDGGEIEAVWDGIFIQQSNVAYDILSVEINGGTITSPLSPIRFYGPGATSVVGNVETPMNLVINGGEFVCPTIDSTKTWIINGIIMYGGGTTEEDLLMYTNIVIYGGTFSSNPSAYIASGYEVVQPGDKYLVQKYVDRSSSSSSSSSTTEPEEPVDPEQPEEPVVEPETPVDEPEAGEATVETEVTDGGEVELETPTEEPAVDEGGAVVADDDAKITAVVLPTGTDSEVTFIPVSEQPAPAGQEENTKKVFEINVPTYEKGKAAVIKFTMTVAELEADGKTAGEVALWHFDEETGEWTKLVTSYTIVDGVVYFEAITNDFSPFAIIYEEAPVDEPVEEPETPASPAPLFAVLAGLGAAVVLRRK